jgi:betaine-aldehyde dehydrogenase
MSWDLWIDGKWTPSSGGAPLKVENPATGEIIDEVVDASGDDVNTAVESARTAFFDGRWSNATPGERARVIHKLADLLESRAEDFARIESEDTGKPYTQVSLGADLPFGVDNLRFFAAAARNVAGTASGDFAAGYT